MTTINSMNDQSGMPGSGSDELRILTGEDCAEILSDLRIVLAKAGLRLEEMDLWDDLEDVRWLATQSGPVLHDLSSPGDPDTQLRIQGFKDAAFIKRSIKSLELTMGFDGWRIPAVHLRDWRIRDISGDDSSFSVQKAQQALDYLYEIEVASRLSFTFSRIRFAEPDLLVEAPDSPLAWTIACKRPRSLKSVLRASRKAVKQISGQGRLGIVMISLDNLVNQVVLDPSGTSLEPVCQERMRACSDTFSKDVLAELEPLLPTPASLKDPEAGNGILGVLTTASFLLLGRAGPDGPTFLNTRMEPSMINRNNPEWAKAASHYLMTALKKADEKLKTRY